MFSGLATIGNLIDPGLLAHGFRREYEYFDLHRTVLNDYRDFLLQLSPSYTRAVTVDELAERAELASGKFLQALIQSSRTAGISG